MTELDTLLAKLRAVAIGGPLSFAAMVALIVCAVRS
jgi:hypothetical protein